MSWKEIASREEGKQRPNSFSRRFNSRRISSLQLSNFKEFISPHRGAVNSLQVDLTEGRYLLSAASDASAAVFDVQRPSEFEGNGLLAKHKCIFLIDKQHEQGHKYAISSATWYPIDTGLFITGSYDHHINVWDTNSTQVVINFKMPGKVYKTSMSPVATTHMLIAAGTEDVQVRLCDIASGAFAHTLSGHRVGIFGPFPPPLTDSSSIHFLYNSRFTTFCLMKLMGAMFRDTEQNSSANSRGHQKKLASENGTKISTMSKTGTQQKGYVKQRVHPGMISSKDRATAHYGAVTGLKTTEDGMYLLSAGSDSRLRLWDIESGCNTLVNFETARLQNSKGIQLAIAQDASLVFAPCMTSVKAFDLWSGQTSQTFRGHYECVNCCWFAAQDQELYTGGNDRQILAWSPPKSSHDERDERSTKGKFPLKDEDNWSD
ncbi:hypothetical protein KSS87_009514 [Heliosperma pusillum]|nr:hypothetical protein KSS87_009514 [Heliosperma pusillum]